MRPRMEIDDIFRSLCPHVYYQAPQSVRLEYPCIIYERNNIKTQKADNMSYIANVGYTVRYVTKDPDDPVVIKLAELPYCSHGKHYVKDNLHHDTYTIY